MLLLLSGFSCLVTRSLAAVIFKNKSGPMRWGRNGGQRFTLFIVVGPEFLIVAMHRAVSCPNFVI